MNYKKYKNVNAFDIIYISEPKGMYRGLNLHVIHKSNNEEESRRILDYIFQKIKEKSDLLRQIQVLKKINGLNEELIENIKKNVRDNYFDIKIDDILKK